MLIVDSLGLRSVGYHDDLAPHYVWVPTTSGSPLRSGSPRRSGSLLRSNWGPNYVLAPHYVGHHGNLAPSDALASRDARKKYKRAAQTNFDTLISMVMTDVCLSLLELNTFC